MLTRHCHAEFFDEDWFWLPERSQNRLRTLTCKILAVASPLDVATIRGGICRAYGRRQAPSIPPVTVIAAFCATVPVFLVDAEGRVRPSTPLDHLKELGKSDRVFVDALRSSPTGVLDRAAFHDACVLRGMTSYTFNVATRISVVLENPFARAWCLRGIRPPQDAAAALRHVSAAKPAQRRVCGYGRRGSTVVWLEVAVPRSRGSSLVVRIPAGVAGQLTGHRFSARADDGSHAGTIVVSDRGSSWGYGRFLSAARARELDVLLVEFDVATHRALLTLVRS